MNQLDAADGGTEDQPRDVLFINEAGELMQVKTNTRSPTEIERIRQRENCTVILNEMPFEEAYDIVFPSTRMGDEIDA